MAMAMERDEEGKHCPVCGNYFYRKGEYCSNACFARYRNHFRTCSYCGKEFYARIASMRYCGDICRAKKKNEQYSANNEKRMATRRQCILLLGQILQQKEHGFRKKKKAVTIIEEKICPVCGKRFLPQRKSKVCCSHECANKKYQSEKRKSKPVYKRKCLFCGKEFETTRKNKGLCSIKCNSCFQKKKHAEKKKREHNALHAQAAKVRTLMQVYRKECPVCGTGFYSVHALYCSKKCEQADF